MMKICMCSRLAVKAFHPHSLVRAFATKMQSETEGKPKKMERKPSSEKSNPGTKPKFANIKEIRKAEAKEILSNLDEKIEQKLDSIYLLYQGLKIESGEVPDSLSDVDLHYMLVHCNSVSSQRKHLSRLWNTQQTKRQKTESQRLIQENEELLNDEFQVYLDTDVYQNSVERRHLMLQKSMSDQPFVIDFDYDITRREQDALRLEMQKCYSVNYRYPLGFHIHFTSIGKNETFYKEYEAGLLDNYCAATFHEKPFWELFPVDRLVYLSPSAPPLTEYDGNLIYIMGGLLNIRGLHTNKTFTKAKALGIRSGSLPLKDYIRFKGGVRESIPVLQVLKVMLSMNLHHDWRRAIQESLAIGKLYTMKSDPKLMTNKHTRKTEKHSWAQIVSRTAVSSGDTLDKKHSDRFANILKGMHKI